MTQSLLEHYFKPNRQGHDTIFMAGHIFYFYYNMNKLQVLNPKPLASIKKEQNCAKEH